jgi:hypothetical protein
MKFVCRVLLLSSIACVAAAVCPAEELSWPKVTNETKPWSRWWWLGSMVTEDGLRSEMEKYAAAGLGGLEITPIYGVRGKEDEFIQYLSPKWVDRFEFVLQQGKRLGLGIDMATGTGWPFGGPWVTPEDTCKYLAHKTFSVKAGEKLAEPVTMVERFMVAPRSVILSQLKEPFGDTPNLQQLAIDNLKMPDPLKLNLLMAFSDAGKEPLNLTSKVAADGTLDWTAPADGGTWTLYAVFDGLHSRMVKRAAPGGEGHVPDHLSGEAIGHYLAKFDQVLAGKSLDGFRSYFSDSYEVDNGTSGEANFTPHFFEEFQKRRGYDLRPLLPVLLSAKGGDEYTRILCDYRETVSDLLLDGFTKTWQQWAAKKGKLVRNQAHGSPANLLDLYAAVDIPETEGFGNPGNPDTELTEVVEMMYASSAAHLTGKRLASSETCTWLDDHFLTTLAHAKQRIDATFLGGINHIFYHGTPYSPPDAAWPGYLFYAAVEFCPANSWWDDFAALNKYVERCQSFLQAGQPDNDILLYVPFHDDWMKPGNGTMPHYAVGGRWPAQEVGRQLLKAGYSFDFISDRQLQRVEPGDGDLFLTDGHDHLYGFWKAIVVPETKYIPLETMKKLQRIANSQCTVIFQKALPSDVSGLGNLEQNRSILKNILASFDQGRDVKEEGFRRIAISGRAGQIFICPDLIQMLSKFGRYRREQELADHRIQFVRRIIRHGDGWDTVYFLVNQGDSAVDGPIALASPGYVGNSVAFFDPMTGRFGCTPAKKLDNGDCQFYLQLSPGQSLIVSSCAPSDEPKWVYYRPHGDAPLAGTWDVSFVKGGPKLPATEQIDKLQSWTEFAGEEGKSFSGTAKYTLEFARPSVKSDAFRLDFGKVADSARVSLNGEELGTLISAPFAIDIPADKLKDQNTLQISVSNLMANRIADMDRRNVPWKIFYNANVAAHDAANRGLGNVFSAANWKPRESGLLGPVTITPLEKFDPLKGQ